MISVFLNRREDFFVRAYGLTVHLMKLQSCNQIAVNLNKRLLGLLILIQHQFGCNRANHLRQLIFYHSNLKIRTNTWSDIVTLQIKTKK